VAAALSFAAFQHKSVMSPLQQLQHRPHACWHTVTCTPGHPVQALGGEGVNMFVSHKRDWSQTGLSWRESLYQERLWEKETLKRLSSRV